MDIKAMVWGSMAGGANTGWTPAHMHDSRVPTMSCLFPNYEPSQFLTRINYIRIIVLISSFCINRHGILYNSQIDSQIFYWKHLNNK